ncbi:hypothetical protein S245_039561, partial [Arachis hypogaea]
PTAAGSQEPLPSSQRRRHRQTRLLSQRPASSLPILFSRIPSPCVARSHRRRRVELTVVASGIIACRRFCENAKMDQVKTSIENGVLTVTVPKAEVKKPGVKPIQITGKPTLPTNFEVTWAKLKSAICAIFLKQPDSCDLEKLYQAVSDLCIYKMAENLYQRIEMECEADISTALQSLVGQSPDLVIFLSLVERYWQDLCESVDRTLLNHLLKMFTTLEIYAESFEKPFLECTSKFYAAQGMKYMQQSDVPDYLKHVEIRLQEEHDRCLIYLDASTRKPLIATPEKQLLERHIPAILDK